MTNIDRDDYEYVLVSGNAVILEYVISLLELSCR